MMFYRERKKLAKECDKWIEDNNVKQCTESVIAYLVVKGLLTQPWTPCKEKTPQNDDNVLATVHYKGANPCLYVDIASCMGEEWSSYSDSYKIGKELHEVIAWKPLPEPYKGE